MKELFCLNDKYSTTKMLYKLVNDECLDDNGKIKEECKWNINNSKFNIKNSKLIGSPEDKFETMLFLPEGEGRKGEGGLRTKGYFKFSFENLMMNDEFLIMNDKYGNQFKCNQSYSTFNIQHSTLKKLPLISIITVVYNGEKYLEETIQSVINQTYPNVEYIIIDGGSTDGTVDIIKKYEDKIDYWVSEKDKGISDAFNKGIILATGKYLNFLNAGDTFINKTILSDIDFYSKLKIITGFAKVRDRTLPQNRLRNNMVLYKKSKLSHQGSFIENNIFKKEGLYNVKYKIRMDYEFFMRILNKYKFNFIPKTIVYFDDSGISSKEENYRQHHEEEIEINEKYLNSYIAVYRNYQIKMKIFLRSIKFIYSLVKKIKQEFQ